MNGGAGHGRSAVSPLPQRQGVDAARVNLPMAGKWATVGAHLVDRLSGLAPAEVEALFTAGRVVAADGRTLATGEPYADGATVWVDRPLADEIVVPFPLVVLHRDERLVVLDKPHFLASMPRGSHVVQSALARARHELGLPGLALAHRLDRLTAGVLVLTTAQRHRGAYQSLFAERAARKTYLAVAPLRADLQLPHLVRNHLRKARGSMQVDVLPDEAPNCATRVELLGADGDHGLYRVTPVGGRTHQIRRHLSDLGIPVLGDPLYPVVRDVPPDDFTAPLQLLAVRLAFLDPVDGAPRVFTSRRALAAWPGRIPTSEGRPDLT